MWKNGIGAAQTEQGRGGRVDDQDAGLGVGQDLARG